MVDFICSPRKITELYPVCLDENGSKDLFDNRNNLPGCFLDQYIPPSNTPPSSAAQNIAFPLYQETLPNGLQIFISPNTESPDVSVKVYFKAGSMQEDPNFTGVAHIFEHFMVSKGSRDVGTTDYAAEDKERSKARTINAQMVALRCGTPKSETVDRCGQFQLAMNQASVAAGRYAIPREAATIFRGFGGSNMNATTSYDRTNYVIDLPAASPNAFLKWARVQANLLTRPAFRVSQTEWEAVFEERNKYLDDKDYLFYPTLDGMLYMNHPYGRDVIGLDDHLKNPSIAKLEEFYRKYYAPNNAAIVIAGNVDVEKAMAAVKTYFGNWKSREIPSTPQYPLLPITEVKKETIYYPGQEALKIGFRTPGANSQDYAALWMISALLNGEAGIFNRKLVLPQKVKSASSYVTFLKEGGFFYLSGSANDKQLLEDVERKLLETFNDIKDGKFSESDLQAVVLNYEAKIAREFESSNNRTENLGKSFVNGVSPRFALELVDRLRALNRDEIQVVAKRYFKKNNYAVVYRRDGERKDLKEVSTPKIAEVKLNHDLQSNFAKEIEKMPNDSVQLTPIQYGANGDFQVVSIGSGSKLYYVHNPLNDLSELTIRYEYGATEKDKAFCNLMNEVSDSSVVLKNGQVLNPSEVAKRLYASAAAVNYNCNIYDFSVKIAGLQKTFPEALELLERQLWHASIDPTHFRGSISKTLLNRKNMVRDPAYLSYGLYFYARYNPDSVFSGYLNRPSDMELTDLTRDPQKEYQRRIVELQKRKPEFYYVGSQPVADVVSLIQKFHEQDLLSQQLNFQARPPYKLRDESSSPIKIYFTNDESSYQAQMWFIVPGEKLNPQKIIYSQLLGYYLGRKGSNLLMKHVREAKGLSYSVGGGVDVGDRLGDQGYIYGYAASQADKAAEAISTVIQLLKDLPIDANNFELNRDNLRRDILNERFYFRDVITQVLSWREKGLRLDPRQERLQMLDQMALTDFKEYVSDILSRRNLLVTVVGKRDKIGLEELRKLGQVEEVDPNQLFRN